MRNPYLLNRSNERINKLEECNEQLRSYIKDLQVYCKELTKWTRESIESKSNENHELICDVNIMYDDVEYLTNLNKKLRAEVDHMQKEHCNTFTMQIIYSKEDLSSQEA